MLRSWHASSTNPLSMQPYQTIGVKPMWLLCIRMERSTTRQIIGQAVSLTCIYYKRLENILLSKLVYYGIRNDILQWITTWLSGRKQKVAIDGVSSDPVPVLSGVPQGSVLGPILFFIFINDLPDNINSTVRLFADDCILYRNIRRSEDQQILQDYLNKLVQWEEAWLMKFNVAKCHSMRVTKHPLPKQIIHDYSLHNQVLENIPSAN